MVERQTLEQEVGGSILTQVTVLYPLARYIYLPKSTGNTQEAVAPSQHDKKIVDWDVKPQPKQTKTYLIVENLSFLHADFKNSVQTKESSQGLK